MRVFVAGAASWDTVVHLDGLPAAASTVFARRSYETVGSTGAGKALAFAALGHDVHLHAVLGADAAGGRVSEELLRAGIHLHVDQDRDRTESHINLMTPDGDRVSIYRSVASPKVDVDVEALVDLAASCDVVVLNITDHVRHLVPAVIDRGVAFWTDLHDWDGVDSYHVDFLAASCIVLSDARLADADRTCRSLAEQGKLVVCTHGAGGATAWSDTETLHVPAYPTDEVVDTNGAGDAFTAALVHGLHAGWGLRRSMEAAAMFGAAAVSTTELAPRRLSAETLESQTRES